MTLSGEGSAKPRVLIAMAADLPARLFSATDRARLQATFTVDVDDAVLDFDDVDDVILAETEIMITGWGAPRIDAGVLDRAPRLRAVLHAAGSVRHVVDPACFARGIAVTSAAEVNAQPVAEYTLAMILLSAKDVFRARAAYRGGVPEVLPESVLEVGANGKRVGVVGASRVGRRVLNLLRSFDFDVWLYDPYITSGEAARLGARKAELDELLGSSDIVTLHAPLLPDTRHMIDARRIALIKPGTTLINTGRGGLIDQDALVAGLQNRRLQVVLDTTEPEPLPTGSPLLSIDDAFVTPHIAGSLGNELLRLGGHAVENAIRLRGARESLAGEITFGNWATIA